MSTSDLAKNQCIPCKGGVPPLEGEALAQLHDELGNGWNLVDEHHLEKVFSLDGYTPAVALTNAIAGIAEEQDHHPNILLEYGKVTVTIWTHKIDGLTESDFYFAAKAEEAFQKIQGN